MTDTPATTPPPHPEDSAAADALVARAIESVLEAVPAVDAAELPEALARYQPWADKAAPSAKFKRPLQALLDELMERVAAEPEARAAVPSGRPPMLAFFDRFGSPRREGEASRPGKRRPRGSKGRAAAGAATEQRAPAAPTGPERRGQQRPATPPSPAAGERTASSAGTGRRRRRRRRRGGGGTGGGGSEGG